MSTSGDGFRQSSPLLPAIRMGASRVLAIGATPDLSGDERETGHRYPSPARIVGHVMTESSMDSLPGDRGAVELFVMQPSERLDRLATAHTDALPRPARAMLDRLGSGDEDGATALLSHLLFEASYTRALIDLGYRDCQACREALARFLEVS